jgi:hypothetical protein
MALASRNAVAKFICSLGPREQPGFKPMADRTYSWQIASLPKKVNHRSLNFFNYFLIFLFLPQL